MKMVNVSPCCSHLNSCAKCRAIPKPPQHNRLSIRTYKMDEMEAERENNRGNEYMGDMNQLGLLPDSSFLNHFNP